MRDSITYRGGRRNVMRLAHTLNRWRDLPRLRTKLTGTRWDTLKDGSLRSFEVATYIVGGA